MKFLKKRPIFLHVDLNQAEPRHSSGTVKLVLFLTAHQLDFVVVVFVTIWICLCVGIEQLASRVDLLCCVLQLGQINHL